MGQLANYQRQLGILPPKLLNRQFVLIGAGGIGSPLAFTLAKMGVTNFTVWDDDTVETHNLPNQFYKLTQLGESKAASLAANLREYAQIKVNAIARKYDGTELLEGIAFSAVDSLDARRIIWEGIQKSPKITLYVEARMAGELFQIYPIVMGDARYTEPYSKMLARKTKPFVAACTAAAIFYTVMASAGIMGEVLKTYHTGGKVPSSVTVDLKNYRMVVEYPRG